FPLLPRRIFQPHLRPRPAAHPPRSEAPQGGRVAGAARGQARRAHAGHPRHRAHLLQRGAGSRRQLSARSEQLYSETRQLRRVSRRRAPARHVLAAGEYQPTCRGIHRALGTKGPMSPKSPQETPASQDPMRLLIADDDPDDIDLCLYDLRKSGLDFQAEIVCTRAEFVHKLRTQTIDVVLSDYRMKDWTGMDALAAVKEIRPDIPVVLLTGTLGDELAVECIK